MIVKLNSEPVEVASGSSLFELLETHQVVDLRGVAVAVNEQVVPKKDWEHYQLKENDRILIIQAVQGG